MITFDDWNDVVIEVCRYRVYSETEKAGQCMWGRGKIKGCDYNDCPAIRRYVLRDSPDGKGGSLWDDVKEKKAAKLKRLQDLLMAELSKGCDGVGNQML